MEKYTTSAKIFEEEVLKQKNKISIEEETALLIEAKKGNNNAKNIIVNKYLAFSIEIAKSITNENNNLFADLIQEGNIALLDCIEQYSLSWSTRFYSYVYLNILIKMKNYLLLNKKQINLSIDLIVLKEKINEYINEYELEYGIVPSKREIIKSLDINTNLLKDINNNNLSFTNEVYDIEENAIKEVSLEKFLKLLVHGAEVNDNIKILLMKYGINCEKIYTSKELSAIFNLSEAKINYIIKRKIQQLHQLLSTENYIKNLIKK